METGFLAEDGSMLYVGDKVRVLDNPDIVPYDDGVIEFRPNHGITRLMETNTDFLFVGRFSETPLDFYVKCGYDIYRLPITDKLKNLKSKGFGSND